jgi:hypothetical protein
VASPELKNDSILPGDVAPNSLTSGRIADGTLIGADVQNGGLTGSDLAANSIPTGRITDESLTGVDVKNNALKGADIDESTLDIGDAARAYGRVGADGSVTQSKNVGGGFWTSEGVYCLSVHVPLSSAVLVVSPDFRGTTPPGFFKTFPIAMWDSSGEACPGGTYLVVRTFTYNGDATDDNDGGGNSTGDLFFPQTEPFSFVVP